eukprot:3400281-Prymnesium_polylepis.1
MIFEISDRESYRMDGLEVYMYPDAVPDDMISEFYVNFGWNGVYSLAISSYEFEVFLDQSQTDYRQIWFGVKCGPEDVLFDTVRCAGTRTVASRSRPRLGSC